MTLFPALHPLARKTRARVWRHLFPTGLISLTLLSGCAAEPARLARAPGMPAGEAAAAIRSSDPVSIRLALYLRLLTPNGGSATELATFLHDNPTWPNHALLTLRLDQALARENDQTVLATLCGDASLVSGEALLHCAGTGQANGGFALPPSISPAIGSAVRAAWVTGVDQPDQEAAFLRIWGRSLTPADQLARFDRLEWNGSLPAAERMVRLLDASQQPLAIARLSLRRNAAGADGIAAALHDPAARDPGLVLDLARWLRRNDRDDEALALWRQRGFTAEDAAPAHRLAFWTERDALARDLLRAHRDADALVMAEDAGQAEPGPRLDAAFLVGWIMLRRLHDPAGAEAKFGQLLQADAAITRSRGFYWTARARLARGDQAGGKAALLQASAYPTTFYGQMALALRRSLPSPQGQPSGGAQTLLDPSHDGELVAASLAALHDPRWSSDQAIRFAGLELAQAAELLVAWDDPRHARAFLLKLDQMATSDTDHALAASLADRLGLPDVAVAIARAAGRHGLILSRSGWPRPYDPPADAVLPDGLALAVMRQESSFDPQIVSPAGAHGLMQVTSGTAHDTARLLGRSGAAGAGDNLSDPAVNMTLGSAYLGGLLTRFGGVVPYAAAAYNAGPHRVDRWLVDDGDPARAAAAGQTADDDRQAMMIDWIETIPFAETRNYVQRVMENMAIYQAGARS